MAKINFTVARVTSFVCPSDRTQAFIWDTEVAGLGVRATPRGKSAYVFQRQRAGRIVIGGIEAWSIPNARLKARELQRLVDVGERPVELKRAKQAAHVAETVHLQAEAITVGTVWTQYLLHGKPKRKDAFKPRYLEDLKRMAVPGGVAKKRGVGVTRPGPIFPLLSMPLADIDESMLLRWFSEEAVQGRHQATRALMMFRGLLRWCDTQPEYRGLARSGAEGARSQSLASQLPAQKRRTDSLEPSQISAWWRQVEQLPNVIVSVYLRALLTTGIRREAMATLKWTDVEFQWGKATFSDKVHGIRTIPLGRRLLKLMDSLPKDNEFVFSGKGTAGYVKDPRASMARALRLANLGHISIHGLRRSFAMLAEDAGVPTGAAEQYMGHSPRGVHEGYKPRSHDQLRVHADRIEAHLHALF